MTAPKQLQVEKLKNRILKYQIRGGKHDIVFNYTLDLDRYELSVSGDIVGSYKWTETRESFIDLLLRCNKHYLYEKLFNAKFDCESSIEKLKETLEVHYNIIDTLGYETKLELFEELDCIDVDCPDCFVQAVQTKLDYTNLANPFSVEIEYEDLWNCVVKTYPYWAVEAMTLFCEHIKPLLKLEVDK